MENVPAQQAPAQGEASASPDTELPAQTSATADEGAHPVLAGFNKLTIVRQIGILAGIALVVALAIAILIWSQDPTYKPLITRLQDHNAQDIVEVLQREGIPFEIDPGTGR